MFGCACVCLLSLWSCQWDALEQDLSLVGFHFDYNFKFLFTDLSPLWLLWVSFYCDVVIWSYLAISGHIWKFGLFPNFRFIRYFFHFPFINSVAFVDLTLLNFQCCYWLLFCLTYKICSSFFPTKFTFFLLCCFLNKWNLTRSVTLSTWCPLWIVVYMSKTYHWLLLIVPQRDQCSCSWSID